MEITNKRYQVIYADPPWSFKVCSNKGKGRSAEHHYQTRNLEYLSSLTIPFIAEKDSALLLWVTFPCLLEAFTLAGNWGFTNKTVAFVWVKTNRNNDRPFIGMGYYTWANAEMLLLFTRGKPIPRIARNVAQVLISPRARHSEKPDEIRTRIVSLFGHVPRIELFARDRNDGSDSERLAGWDVFGDEISNSVQLPP